MRSEYRPHAVPRYSPVGSNPLVNPKSSMAVRYVPPFVDGPEGEAASPPPPPHAVAMMASTPTTARTLELRFKVSIGPLPLLSLDRCGSRSMNEQRSAVRPPLLASI